MSKSKLVSLALALGSLTGITAFGQTTTTTIVSDTFQSTADRQTGTLATDRANWFVLSNNATTQGQTVVAGGSSGTALSVDTHSIVGSSNAYMMRWTPTSLSVGDTLTVSLSLSFTRLPASGTTAFRFGVFDSTFDTGTPANNGVISGDVTSANQTKFIGDNGYTWTGNGSLNLGPGATGANLFNIGERTTLTAGNVFSAGADFTNLGTANGANAAWATNTVYTFTMSFNLVSASQLDISETLSGGNFGSGLTSTLVSDSSPSALSFDYMLFRASTANAADITFSGLNVSLTSPSAVPEPSTYAVIAGLGILGLALVRRRKA